MGGFYTLITEKLKKKHAKTLLLKNYSESVKFTLS